MRLAVEKVLGPLSVVLLAFLIVLDVISLVHALLLLVLLFGVILWRMHLRFVAVEISRGALKARVDFAEANVQPLLGEVVEEDDTPEPLDLKAPMRMTLPGDRVVEWRSGVDVLDVLHKDVVPRALAAKSRKKLAKSLVPLRDLAAVTLVSDEKEWELSPNSVESIIRYIGQFLVQNGTPRKTAVAVVAGIQETLNASLHAKVSRTVRFGLLSEAETDLMWFAYIIKVKRRSNGMLAVFFGPDVGMKYGGYVIKASYGAIVDYVDQNEGDERFKILE